MGGLSFSDRAARSVWRIFPKRALSGAIGWGSSRNLPNALRVAMLSRFASAYGIDASEAEKPLAEYSGFDDFFTRNLRPGARPVDRGPGRVVSTSDGTVVESGVIEAGKLIQAKGVLFALDELISDAESAARLGGGAYFITYLSPKDYHRVHSPVAGRIVGWRHIPGVLFPVNARSVNREPRLFVGNERFVTFIEGEAGFTAVVMIAAVGVGHVTAAYDDEIATHRSRFLRAGLSQRRYDQPRPIGRGDELGTFHLGSTTIVVFEPGRVTLDALTPGSAIKMGVGIGRFVLTAAASRGA
jgi:phosphatidylserine decarboxylase